MSIRSWSTNDLSDPDQTADTVRHHASGEETARVHGRAGLEPEAGSGHPPNAAMASTGFAAPGRDSSPPKVFRGRDTAMRPANTPMPTPTAASVQSTPLSTRLIQPTSRPTDRQSGPTTAATQGHAWALAEVIPSSETGKHMRHDVITDRWMILSPGREDRPMDFATREDLAADVSTCPFCRGNEGMTPTPIWIDGSVPSVATDGRPWSVRVVPNRYPAVESGPANGSQQRVSREQHIAPEKRSATELFRTRSAVGFHEVIIESDRHVRSTTDLTPAEVAVVLAAYQDRLQHFAQQGEVGYVSIFKNVGSEAGASLTHSHSQLVATRHVPDDVQTAFLQMERHRSATGSCLQCDLVSAEERAGVRVVESDGDFIAFCPFASLHPMMIRITSHRHVACLGDFATDMRHRLARLLHRTVLRLETMFGPVAYNYVLNSRPLRQFDDGKAFHWSLDLFPRQTKVAGFEWNTGMMINPVLPESAAARYREV